MVKSTTTGTQPTRKLGPSGQKLWTAITSEYSIADAGGVEMLVQACRALDRAEACREQIDRDGEVVATKNGPREHPLLKPELARPRVSVRTLAASRSGRGAGPAHRSATQGMTDAHETNADKTSAAAANHTGGRRVFCQGRLACLAPSARSQTLGGQSTRRYDAGAAGEWMNDEQQPGGLEGGL